MIFSQWVFWITVPVAVGAIIVVNLVLPLKPVHGDMKK
jgi:hypothetical protein